MKISRKDQKLLLCVGGILLAVLAYFTVFRSFSNKNEALKSENKNLSEQVQQLEILEANREQYIADTKKINAKLQEIIDKYPSEVREEDAVMYAYEMENETDIHVSSMTIAPANHLYTMGQNQELQDAAAADSTNTDGTTTDTTTTDTTTTDTTNTDSTTTNTTTTDSTKPEIQGLGYELCVVTVDMAYAVSYDGFKDIVDFICSDKDKRNVESVSLSYDSETGQLLGTMVVNLYELRGTDKAYEAPYIPAMPKGNTNPFGTAGVSTGERKEAAQDEEQSED